jgi:hypothetical protein
MSSLVPRRAAAVLALSVAALQPVVLAAPASAETGYSQCTGQDRVVERSVRLTSNRFTMTHGDVLDLGRGISYHRKRTMEKVTVLSATASGSVETTGGVSWKIAKLDAKTTYSLSGSGSRTRSTSLTEDFDVPAANRNRKILFYHGNQHVQGRWHQLTCSRAPGRGTEYEGSVKSFAPLPRSGAIECNHRLYKVGTVRYLVTRQAGC